MEPAGDHILEQLERPKVADDHHENKKSAWLELETGGLQEDISGVLGPQEEVSGMLEVAAFVA